MLVNQVLKRTKFKARYFFTKLKGIILISLQVTIVTHKKQSALFQLQQAGT